MAKKAEFKGVLGCIIDDKKDENTSVEVFSETILLSEVPFVLENKKRRR